MEQEFRLPCRWQACNGAVVWWKRNKRDGKGIKRMEKWTQAEQGWIASPHFSCQVFSVVKGNYLFTWPTGCQCAHPLQLTPGEGWPCASTQLSFYLKCPFGEYPDALYGACGGSTQLHASSSSHSSPAQTAVLQAALTFPARAQDQRRACTARTWLSVPWAQPRFPRG